MPHFSRLTDIVTCSLTEIVDSSADPAGTLQEIIEEMEEGLICAHRTVQTSSANKARLADEIAEHSVQATEWMQKARQALAEGNESAAREFLTRKVEVEDVIDGLKPELEAAESAYNHMLRIQKALEARHAEALRRLSELTGDSPTVQSESETAVHAVSQLQREKSTEVEAELDALRKELGN